MTTTVSAKPRRKRCLNDNKLFTPARNMPDQKFCGDACRKEFHRHGSAFGPMKAGLYKAIEQKYKSLRRETWVMVNDSNLTTKRLVESLRVEAKELRAQIDALRGQYEGHTHDTVSAFNGEYEEHEILGPKEAKKTTARS